MMFAELAILEHTFHIQRHLIVIIVHLFWQVRLPLTCKARKSNGIYFIINTISWGKTMLGVKLCKVFGTYPLAFCTGISLRDWILNYFSPRELDLVSCFVFFSPGTIAG